jgi:hypothetical protein
MTGGFIYCEISTDQFGHKGEFEGTIDPIHDVLQEYSFARHPGSRWEH